MQITNEAKNAILNCLANAAYAVGNAQTLYDALAAAFFPVESISVVYTQSGTVTTSTPLDSLRSDLVVTANYEGGTSETVTSYVLSGTLTVGTSTITVSYGGKTATFNVTVTDSKVWDLGEGIYVNDPKFAIAGAATASRGIYLSSAGDSPHFKRQSSSDTTSFSDSEYYLIPIPSGATGIKVTTSNTNVYAAVYASKYDTSVSPVTGWTRLSQIGWVNSTTTLTLPSGATHWAAAIKHGSAGTAAVTTSDTQALTFEYVY